MFKHTFIIVLGLAVLTVGCGIGGGGGGGGGGSDHVNTAAIAGTWYGPIRNSYGNLGSVTVIVDTTGGLSFSQSASPSSSGSGSISPVEGHADLYAVDVGGTPSGFILDATMTRAGLASSDGYLGMVQKGASSLPVHTSSQLNGSWSGTGVTVKGSAFELQQVFTTSMSAAYPNISGSDANGTFSGTLMGFTAASGYGYGTGSGYTLPDMRMMLSPDGAAIALRICRTSGTGTYTYPDSCAFSLLHK